MPREKEYRNAAEYDKWYFGQFHMDSELWKNQPALLDNIRELHSGKIIRKKFH